MPTTERSAFDALTFPTVVVVGGGFGGIEVVQRLAGKPYKVIITAVARKLVNLANALCKSRQKWAPLAP